MDALQAKCMSTWEHKLGLLFVAIIAFFRGAGQCRVLVHCSVAEVAQVGEAFNFWLVGKPAALFVMQVCRARLD